MRGERIGTSIGTAVIRTPKRVYNPVHDKYQDMTRLSEDGYCRRFLAVLSEQTRPNVVNLDSSPVATFDTEKWRLEETDGHYVLIKRSAETRLDELVLGIGDADDD